MRFSKQVGDKKWRLIARIFCLAFLLAFVTTLLDGQYHYYSMGNKQIVSEQGNPVKYYFSLFWYGTISLIAGYYGFMAKLKS